MSEELYPELIKYIFDYSGNFFLQSELIANKHLTGLSKAKYGLNTPMYKIMQEKGFISLDKDVTELTRDGFNAFKIKVATRIYNEHKDKLNLNLCPKCFKIARTPLAKQCRFCFHYWH
jgi:hypothetical protein